MHWITVGPFYRVLWRNSLCGSKGTAVASLPPVWCGACPVGFWPAGAVWPSAGLSVSLRRGGDQPGLCHSQSGPLEKKENAWDRRFVIDRCGLRFQGGRAL